MKGGVLGRTSEHRKHCSLVAVMTVHSADSRRPVLKIPEFNWRSGLSIGDLNEKRGHVPCISAQAVGGPRRKPPRGKTSPSIPQPVAYPALQTNAVSRPPLLLMNDDIANAVKSHCDGRNI